MSEQITTSCSNYTSYFADGEQIYPCRCGEIHRGEHGICTFLEHECYHKADLVLLCHVLNEEGQERGYALCPDCAQTFFIDESVCEDEEALE